MRINASYAGVYRNFSKFIGGSSKVIYKDNGYPYISGVIYVRNGQVVEEIAKYQGKITKHQVLGKFIKKYDTKGKLISYYEQQPGILDSRHGKGWEKCLLFGYRGKVFSQFINGRLTKQTFRYSNGRIAYKFSRYQDSKGKSEMIVRRPDGSKWAVLKGQLIGHTPTTHILYNVSPKEIISNLRGNSGVYDFEITVYNTAGRKYTHGKYQSSQRVGKWLYLGKNVYYLSGVPVSKEIYSDDPKKWDANEILNIGNAQLRAALLKKFTFERLIKKTNSEVIHSIDDMRLIQIESPAWQNERYIVLLKVKCPSTGIEFVLRVPPSMRECEEARQWTFGADMKRLDNRVYEEDYITLKKET